MSDELQALDLSKISISATFVIGAVMSAFGWWLKRHEYRADRHEQKLAEIERELERKVSLDVHNATLEAIRREIRETMTANTEAVNAATKQNLEAITRTHDRIDGLMSFLAQQNKPG